VEQSVLQQGCCIVEAINITAHSEILHVPLYSSTPVPRFTPVLLILGTFPDLTSGPQMTSSRESLHIQNYGDIKAVCIEHEVKESNTVYLAATELTILKRWVNRNDPDGFWRC
jgi:hypothetical protein